MRLQNVERDYDSPSRMMPSSEVSNRKHKVGIIPGVLKQAINENVKNLPRVYEFEG